jgi:hypothetical protein
VSVSAPEDELAAAAVSQWTTRVVAFTRWVGAGRKLTQAGRLTLAHARELAELLDTGDVLDPLVGGQVHRTKSSEELPELNTVFEWAKAARLVRVTGGRVMVVKKNAALLERPLPLWERMFETFGALGPAICPPGWRVVAAPPLGRRDAGGTLGDLRTRRSCKPHAKHVRGAGRPSAAATGWLRPPTPSGTPGGGATTGTFAALWVCWHGSARFASTGRGRR